MSEANPPPRQLDARVAPRTNMFIAASLIWEQHRNPVKIRNMSITGALVESPVVPPLGSSALLVRGSFSAGGRVVWSDRNRCGIHLTAAVHVRDWLTPPSNAEQQRRSGLGQGCATILDSERRARIAATRP